MCNCIIQNEKLIAMCQACRDIEALEIEKISLETRLWKVRRELMELKKVKAVS